jgi:Na+-translocating ferredoxin:NAD+ oxidoreductase RNF subunit RnfB
MIYAIIILGTLGLAYGLGLAFASRKFHVDVDPKIEAIVEALPSANCGACGYPGCAGYAEAIVNNDEELNKCAPGGSAVVAQIAEIMGKEASAAERRIAVIKCQSGGTHNTFFRYEYQGVPTCQAAVMLNNGPNLCSYGCVFQNDCIAACKFDAISVDENGMRLIDKDKCTGCGACVAACPRNLIELVLEKKRVHILCSSHDPGAVAKKVCGNSTACIGCGICVKKCPKDAIELKNYLAVLSYDLCIMCGLCADACPTGAIIDPLKEVRAKKRAEAKQKAEAAKKAAEDKTSNVQAKE